MSLVKADVYQVSMIYNCGIMKPFFPTALAYMVPYSIQEAKKQTKQIEPLGSL